MNLTPDPLAGPMARIDRAKFHLDQLMEQVELFLGQDPYTTSRERDDARGRYIWHVSIKAQPSDSLRFLASDFIHNARAALDNVVWALAPAKVRHRKARFPVYESPVHFKAKALPMLDGMKPEIIQAIEWCQPYHGHEHFDHASRLLDLNRLSNFDKHRAPFAVGFLADMAAYALFHEGPDFPMIQVAMNEALTEGKEIAWIPLHPSLSDDFNPRFHFGVAFVGAGKRPIPYYGLSKMHEIVSKEVIGAIRKAL